MSSDCLELTDVLKGEYLYLHDFYPAGATTWQFKRDHIINPGDLVLHLQENEKRSEPFTKLIVEKLSLAAKEQLNYYKKIGDPPESLQNSIIEALNSLLEDPFLGDAEGIPKEWKAEAKARAQTDMSTPRFNPQSVFKTPREITCQVTREITREQIRKTNGQTTLEISRNTMRQATCKSTAKETLSFNRRLLEIAYPAEIKPVQDTLSGVYNHLHSQGHSALCLSGGGVRSATFCLGILEGLAQRGLLDKFDYLSTVSGGGYIGGWLSAWAHRHPNGLPGVMRELTPATGCVSMSSKDPEPKPVRHLRSFANFLTPKLGLLSGDSWALIGTYLRNLFLNWLVLIPLIAAAIVIVPKLYVGIIVSLRDAASPVPLSWISYGSFAVGLGFILISEMYIGFNRPSTGYRRHGDETFWLFGLMPLMIGAAWLAGAFYGSQLNFKMPFWQFAFVGVALKTIGWGFQFPARTLRISEIQKGPDPSAWELVAAVVAGTLGGLMLWVATLIVSDPWIKSSISAEVYAGLSVPILLLILLAAETIFIGLISRSTPDEDAEWWSRAGGWVLLAAAFWAVVNLTVLYGPFLLPEISELSKAISGSGADNSLWTQALFAVIGVVSGILTVRIGKGTTTPATGQVQSTPTKIDSSKVQWLQPMLKRWSLIVLPAIFIVFLIALISSGIDWLARWEVWSSMGRSLSARFSPSIPWVSRLYVSFDDYPWTVLFVLLLGFGMLGLVMAHFVDANKFSLNSGYRNRLIRAYLGASRNYRNPNPFTGFDPEDNLPICELAQPNRFGLVNHKLFHILNLTLNLASGDNLAWQERKAESFTVSPLHCGSREIGYRSSEEYCREKPPTPRATSLSTNGPGEQSSEAETPITLGSAMSLSGAVASPNMGYYSSGPVAFLMTLFNVRLGAWLKNPGRCGDKAEGKLYSYCALISELFGRTNDRSRYVYVSDGGHFENLGLFEMVLRRCHDIVVIDAGHDSNCTFRDLGKAIRQIRMDLGVSIDFKDMNIYPRNVHKENATYFAIGTIGYSKVDDNSTDGRLLYIKAAFYEDEEFAPRDIYEYAKRCTDFPHDPTTDQWFSESQFESYRALGYYIFDRIAGKGERSASIKEFIDYVEKNRSNGQKEQTEGVDALVSMLTAIEGRSSKSQSFEREW